jgi:peptidoglycan/xylan/chitin deacetylase (PgdA/CDA1 family)
MLVKQILVCFLCFLIFFSCSFPENNRQPNSGESNGSSISITEKLNALDISASGFLYHRFSENKYPGTSISAALFEQQLIYLTEQKIPVITLGGFSRLTDSIPDVKKFVILTVDDAFRSFYEHGFPLLKKYGLKATLFVNTETIGSNDYSGWEELREMLEYGIELGNHTHSHAYFLNDPAETRQETFSNEVNLAQQIFRDKLGIECLVFAYPFGEYDADMQRIIRDSGFVLAVAQHSGVISGYSDPYALPRFPMTDQYGQMPSFREKVNMLALPVINIHPSTTIPVSNPPVLQVSFTDPGLDLSRLKGYVQGSESAVSISEGDTVMAEITALHRLTGRRALYTITVPHTSTGKWYWFSHQWVIPEIP